MLLFLLFTFAECVIYFLDSNVHIRIFTNNEGRNDTNFDLVWYEYGHLSSLTYGANENLWTFGTFNFGDYQVLSLDAECSLRKQGCETTSTPHEHAPSQDTFQPNLLSNTFKVISVIEVTKERLFIGYQSDENDAWEVSRFDPDDASLNGETIVPASAQKIQGLTMDNTTIYYFTTSSTIKFQELGSDGIHGDISRPDMDVPRNIFWRKQMLWVLSGDGQAITHIDLKEFKKTEKVVEHWLVNFTHQFNNETNPPEYHIPCMTVTNESIFYIVEELTANITVANWTLHERSLLDGRHWMNEMPANTTRLYPAYHEGEKTTALEPHSSFLTSSNTVSTSIITPDLSNTDYEARGVRIFVAVTIASSVVTGLVIYIGLTAK